MTMLSITLLSEDRSPTDTIKIKILLKWAILKQIIIINKPKRMWTA